MDNNAFNADQQLQAIRSELLNASTLIAAGAGILAIVTGMVRWQVVGPTFPTLLQLVGGTLLIAQYFARYFCNYHVRALLLVLILWLLGVLALSATGQAGVGSYLLILVMPSMGTMFWSVRVGIFSFVLGIVTSGGMAGLWTQQHIRYAMDIAAYLQTGASWFIFLCLISVLAMFLVCTQWVMWARLGHALEQLQTLNERLAHRASTDRMTNIWNRGHFLDIAEQALEQAQRYRQPLAMLMLDIDLFKNINDRFGHATGDEAIRAFVRIGQSVLRKSDFMGRMGGEEFAIALPNTAQHQAMAVAERLRLQVENHELHLAGSSPLRMTVSIGLSMATDDTLERMLARADAALYTAKHRGRNQLVVADALADAPSPHQESPT